MALTGYSGAWGKLIHERNLKSKISWHCPLFFATLMRGEICYRRGGRGVRGVRPEVMGRMQRHEVNI
jgi:hypothetical protein